MFDIDLNLKNMPDFQWSLEIVLLTGGLQGLAFTRNRDEPEQRIV